MNGIVAYSITTEEYNKLIDSEARLELLLTIVRAIAGPISVGTIAKILGIGRDAVVNNPWRMPNLGRGQEPGKKRFWTVEEYLDWVIIPEEERIKMFREFTQANRDAKS